MTETPPGLSALPAAPRPLRLPVLTSAGCPARSSGSSAILRPLGLSKCGLTPLSFTLLLRELSPVLSPAAAPRRARVSSAAGEAAQASLTAWCQSSSGQAGKAALRRGELSSEPKKPLLPSLYRGAERRVLIQTLMCFSPALSGSASPLGLFFSGGTRKLWVQLYSVCI